MNKQLTALALLVAGTITGNAFASCRSCKEQPVKPKCVKEVCYEKEVCPKKEYYYTCPSGYRNAHKDGESDKESKAKKKVKSYDNNSKRMNKNGNGKSKK